MLNEMYFAWIGVGQCESDTPAKLKSALVYLIVITIAVSLFWYGHRVYQNLNNKLLGILVSLIFYIPAVAIGFYTLIALLFDPCIS